MAGASGVTFFKPSQPPSPAPSSSFQGITRTRQAGDRTLAHRDRDADIPSHRRDATVKTLEGRGTVGLSNAAVLDRLPRGCAFPVAGGFFDLDGYWCVKKADNRVEVRRGSQKKILKLLTPPQKKELARLRLQARRHGMR